MTKCTRRSLLKSATRLSLAAGAMSVAPALIGCTRSRDRAMTLNVVLHGLFVLNFTNLDIELFTPFVKGHCYKAGRWDWNNVHSLKPGEVYQLRGVSSETVRPIIDETYNLAAPQYCSILRPQYSYFMAHLPFPKTVSLIRCVQGDKNTICQNGDGHYTYTINRLSLCQVLTYRVPDYRALRLHNAAWSPTKDPDTNTANLHFWAEPRVRLEHQHAENAYRTLSDMLAPLCLKLNTDHTAPLDLDTGVFGLRPEEEQGLSEWQSAGEGSYPTNCSTVIRS